MGNANQSRILDFSAIQKACLQFKNPETEALYQEASAPIRKLHMRIALFFVAILYAILALIDPYIIQTQESGTASTVHFSQAFAFALLSILSLRFQSLFFHTGMVIASVCAAWLNHLWLVDLTHAQLLFSEAFLMIIWTWLISGLSFKQAKYVNLYFIATYEISVFLAVDDVTADIIAQHFFIFVSLAFGAFSGYIIEFHRRYNFLSLQQVSEQAVKLSEANAQLAKDKATLTKLSHAIEQAEAGILIADMQAITEYINPAFTRITGFRMQDLQGKVPALLKPLHKSMWKTLRRGEVWSGNIEATRKDGSTFPAWLSVAPLKDRQGNITHYAITMRDITKQQKLEDQFRQAQKMEAIGTLVGGMAHDFNNTLMGITGNLYLAKEDVQHMPDTLEKLEHIEELSFHASDMVKQLLAFSRKGNIHMKPLSLNKLLEKISKLHKVALPAHVHFKQDIQTDDDVTVCADASLLQQVIINLLNNARDALEDVKNPEISMTLSTCKTGKSFKSKHPHINSNRFAVIAVKDNGHGIKPEDIPMIFEPFFTTKAMHKGTGLGLSMVYGTMQSHGGTVTVESQWQEGTTFKLYIPLIDEDGHLLTRSIRKPVTQGQGETILLVDDDPSVLSTASDILRNLGYDVLQATNGEEALSMYDEHGKRIKLVVMDIAMPKMDGVEAAEHLRQRSRDLPIIFITGFDTSQRLQHVQKHSDTIISKPFKVRTISEAIQQALSGDHTGC